MTKQATTEFDSARNQFEWIPVGEVSVEWLIAQRGFTQPEARKFAALCQDIRDDARRKDTFINAEGHLIDGTTHVWRNIQRRR